MLSADKEHTACFTGHRIIEMLVRELEEKTFEAISKAVSLGYTHFIYGGALGFDMISAEQVIFHRCIDKDITLEIALPCKDHFAKWSYKQKCRLNAILEVADKIKYVTETEYIKDCMQLRNKYMVLKSSLVIAYFTGKPSGTKNTIDFAERQLVEIIIL